MWKYRNAGAVEMQPFIQIPFAPSSPSGGFLTAGQPVRAAWTRPCSLTKQITWADGSQLQSGCSTGAVPSMSLHTNHLSLMHGLFRLPPPSCPSILPFTKHSSFSLSTPVPSPSTIHLSVPLHLHIPSSLTPIPIQPPIFTLRIPLPGMTLCGSGRSPYRACWAVLALRWVWQVSSKPKPSLELLCRAFFALGYCTGLGVTEEGCGQGGKMCRV